MALKFNRFVHKTTGQQIHIPGGRYGNFRNAVHKLVNYVNYNYERYFVVLVTLTVAENVSEVDEKDLHRVLQFIGMRLKRSQAEGKYIAVKEFQKRGAVHYHILYVYNKPYVFPSSAEIARSWGLGFVKVSAPKIRMKLTKLIAYIGKYIGKGYDFESLEFKKSFTASQIKQIYKLKVTRLEAVIREFGKNVAESFKCTFTRVYEVLEMDPFPKKRKIVMSFESEWGFAGTVGEPF